jgi:hypothetical protein
MRSRHPLAAAAVVLSLGCPLAGETIPPGLSHLFPPCPSTPPCGDDCSNTPFRPTDCKTTDYGPARANIVIGSNPLISPNMLYCPGGSPYALCFFSGPPHRTGDSLRNNRLPCVPIPGTNLANCSCQVYNAGPYYVDINSILNLGAFYETKEICGADGSLCKNIRDCNDQGESNPCAGNSTDPCPACPSTVAPVCAYIDAQSKGSSKGSFYPQPDLVSTFSFAMGTASPGGAYQLGSTPCSGDNAGRYAGCMTAPCNYPKGSTPPLADGSIVYCACPLWYGDYQVGQNGRTCAAQGDDWVWSAANAVADGSP